MSGRRLLSLALRLFGLVFLGFAVVTTVAAIRFLNHSVVVQGRVVEFAVTQSVAPLLDPADGGGTTIYPVVEYHDQNDVARRFEARAGIRPGEFQIDDPVSVRVAAGTPPVARIDRFMNIWGGSVILAALGIGFVVIGFLAPLGFRTR